MKKRKIIGFHLLTFVILTIVLFLSAEYLLKLVFPAIHNVQMWLDFLIFGTTGILILSTISCLIFLKKGKNHIRIEELELLQDGFRVNYDGEITKFQWSEINKLTGYKFDQITMDVICLKIDANGKTVTVTEDFNEWRDFMNTLLTKFSTIDKNWEEVIAKPPFERNETVLYDRQKNVG